MALGGTPQRCFGCPLPPSVPPRSLYILNLYAPAAKLCVDVDGEQHTERQEADALRDAYLAEQDIFTLRIPSLDLFEKESDRYS